jgi:8-oxo-dGTP diphosphatase
MAISTANVGLPVIRAAGGILLRSSPSGDELMIVHRKRHQDWTLPKGRLREGESFQETAVRKVEEETGYSCRLGEYLGTISYPQNGVPKVVMFWKMTVIKEKPTAPSEGIGEAVWLPLPAAIQRLTYAQEKALLTRLGGGRGAMAPAEPSTQPQPPWEPLPRLKQALFGNRAEARLIHEAQALRVQLQLLEQRGQRPDMPWALAANRQLEMVTRCLETHDLEGGLTCLQAARRYAVFGLTGLELAARAQTLRQDAARLPGWQAQAVVSLLALPDEQISPECVAEAMAVGDACAVEHYYGASLAGDQLPILLLVCVASAIALLPWTLLNGPIRMMAPTLLFGLLGSSFSAAHSLLKGRIEARNANLFVLLTPVFFGAIAGLGGYVIYELAVSVLKLGTPLVGAMLAVSFLGGCVAQRLLEKPSTENRRSKSE